MSESAPAIPPFVDAPAPRPAPRVSARPTTREWVRHLILFLITFLTTTFAGVMLAIREPVEPVISSPVTLFDYLLYVPEYYLKMVGLVIVSAVHQPALLSQGVSFSLALLAILTAHEFGHYIACRRHGVDATLPFFIPAPPLFLAGTFGAFIKIKSHIPSRRALFDIGVAGPLAGFVVALPVTVIGLLVAQHAPLATPHEPGQTLMVFNDPLLIRLMARLLGIQWDALSTGNSFYFAAWIGLLVTSLNLMPVGQLDGGHATYSIFGARTHKWVGLTAFITMSVLAVLGWMWHGSPSGFLYAVLLGVILRLKHPTAGDETEPLGRARILVAVFTLLVFILSFWPFPISII
jgi:membrane-associated protease RseP (regulator of RpoE activity)